MSNAYITNNGTSTVSVIDTVSDAVTATITVGANPVGSAVTPDGTKAYVTNFNGSSVSVIETANNTVITTITVGTRPISVAITPDGTKAYVANRDDNTVSAIDTASNTVIGSAISVGSGPEGLAITPDGARVYVVNGGAATVSVINTASNTIIGSAISVAANPYGLAITPDGRYAYVANGTTVSVIDLATNSVTTTISSVGTSLRGVAVSPDGATVYVTDNSSNTVAVIDTATNTVSGSPISVGNVPIGVAFTPDGSKAYVANSGGSPGTVSVIDTATRSVIHTLTVGNNPYAFGQFIVPAPSQIAFIMPPQGRLTLSSAAPVMTADATAQTTIYYLPYQGAGVPIYNGKQYVNYLTGASGLSLALDSNAGHTGYQGPTGSLFDIFAFLNNGVVTLGTGPAWTNSTTRSSAIAQVKGLWVNSATITLRFGNASGSTASVLAQQATYLGTMYATAAGQTGMQFTPTGASGGTNNILGLYNAYNRVLTSSALVDSKSSWPAATSQGPADGSGGNTNNRINWVDGLRQSWLCAEYQVQVACTTGAVAFVLLGLNSTATNEGVAGSAVSTTGTIRTAVDMPPQQGFNFVQALEDSTGGSGATFYGGTTMQLKAVLEM